MSQGLASVFKELSSSPSDARAVVSYVIRFLFKYDWSVIMGVATFERRPLSGYLTKTRTSVASRVYPSKLNRTFFGGELKCYRIAGQVDFFSDSILSFTVFTKGIWRF